MRKARFQFLLIGSCLVAPVLAQQVPDSLNLVPNGSFEELEGKLRRLGGIDAAKGWSSPTQAKADLFSESVASESPASAPKNAKGF
ncbi:MAG: hypothetical protein JSU02_03625, partial [Bacteroidetes bacterium]|nr:hypothetical protein [Bacteroidota bacterium]